MTKVRLKGLLSGLVLALLLTLPLQAAEATAHTYVLLVGISEYADQQIKPRPHAEADAQALYDLFTDKDYLGVDADRICVDQLAPQTVIDQMAALLLPILRTQPCRIFSEITEVTDAYQREPEKLFD